MGHRHERGPFDDVAEPGQAVFPALESLGFAAIAQRESDFKSEAQKARERRREGHVSKGGRGLKVEIVHGTATAYTNHGCRCDACREAIRKYTADRRERLKREFAAEVAARKAAEAVAPAAATASSAAVSDTEVPANV